jgi:hypothetical protein
MTCAARWTGKAAFLSAILLFAPAPPIGNARDRDGALPQSAACLKSLEDIFAELREAWVREDGPFFKWECFIGGPDDDDTNKDQHVVIMILRSEEGPEMKISVTALERSRGDPRIKYARGTRTVVCLLGGATKVLSSDYDADPLGETAGAVLRAVRDKKRLLDEGLSRGVFRDRI